MKPVVGQSVQPLAPKEAKDRTVRGAQSTNPIQDFNPRGLFYVQNPLRSHYHQQPA